MSKYIQGNNTVYIKAWLPRTRTLYSVQAGDHNLHSPYSSVAKLDILKLISVGYH